MSMLRVGRQAAKLCLAFLFLCLFVLGPHSAATADTFSRYSNDFEAAGFHLNGRFIYDANNVNFVMRGVNHPHNWFMEQTSSLAHIKAKGANTVRVVLSSGAFWEQNSADDVANVIALCKANELVCVLEVHDTTGYIETPAISLGDAVDYWKSIKSVLDGEEAYVIINLGNEPYGNESTEGWLDDTTAAIVEMREAGFEHMLMVDAPNWGQDWESVMLNNAADVLASDENGNTVFSIHMYGVYEDATDIENYISTFVNAGLPIVVGEFGHLHSDGDPDEDAILSVAEEHGIGYLGWSWSGNSGVGYLDLVTDFNPNKLTPWGKRLFYGENGICLTSVEASLYGGDRDPMVCSIKTAGLNPSNVSTVKFTVTFSESVTGVGVDDFVLATTNTSGAAITGVSGSGSVYTVTANAGSGNGTVRLNLVDNDSIQDLTGNVLSGAGIGNGNLNWGDTYTIKKITPVLLSPANGVLVNSLRPTFDWKDSVPAFDHYQIQIATNKNFTSPMIDKDDVPDSTFTPDSDLAPGAVHYWRVRGINSLGDFGAWSSAWNFKAPLSQPELLAPKPNDLLTTDRPAFEWHDVPGATGYALQVSAQSNFSTLLVNAAVVQSQYTMFKDLPQNKILYWRVRAKSPVVIGPWSGKGSFTTGNPPAVPVLSAPANNALVKDYTPTLNWNNTNLQTGMTFKYYEIQLDEDKEFSSHEASTTTLDDITDSDFTPLAELASNTKFYWRVRAVNTDNISLLDHTSGWSKVWSFRAAILPPTGLNMTPGFTPQRPHLAWDAATGPGVIKSYTIQISTNANFSTLLVNSTTPKLFYDLLKNLPTGKIIYWRVRVNGDNGPSGWSTSQFTLP